MTVKELIKELQEIDKSGNMEVNAFFHHEEENCGYLESVISICVNGPSIQLNMESTEKTLQE